jgi:hypothetical protein
MGMSELAVSRHLPIPRGMGLWVCGLAVGLVGGFATLTINPVAGVAALLLWICLAVAAPRFSGLAGALVGHGMAWVWLLLTSHVACAQSFPAQCAWSLAYGPAHLDDMAAWQTETRAWFAFALGLLAIGVLLTVWTTRRVRRGLSAG